MAYVTCVRCRKLSWDAEGIKWSNPHCGPCWRQRLEEMARRRAQTGACNARRAAVESQQRNGGQS